MSGIATSAPAQYQSLKNAALGTALVFTASGSVLGTWVSRLPAIREDLGVSKSALGGALLVLGIGSLLSMPLTGHVCRRFGTRAVVLGTAVLANVVMSVLPLAPNLTVLATAMFTLGLFYGSWDVAMNVQGSTVDQRTGRQWMPRYHACWSVGSLLGAAFGALAAREHLAVPVHFAIAALAAAVAAGVGLLAFVDDRQPQPDAGAPKAGRPRRLVNLHLLLIGLITFCAMVVEGAAADWMAIYLADERDVSHASAALGFTVFATSMAIGRFVGTPVAERLGRATAVRVAGVLGVAGVLLTVFSPALAASYAGALLWGAGICLVFPAAVSAAGETARPAESIAFVTTFGYGSILIGPPLIGVLADQIGLGPALLSLVLLSTGVAILAPAVREAPRPAPAPTT